MPRAVLRILAVGFGYSPLLSGSHIFRFMVSSTDVYSFIRDYRVLGPVIAFNFHKNTKKPPFFHQLK